MPEEAQELLFYLDQADQAARKACWHDLAESTLILLKDICRAEAALIFQPDLPNCPIPRINWPGKEAESSWATMHQMLLKKADFNHFSAQIIEPNTPSPLPEAMIQALPEFHNLILLPFPVDLPECKTEMGIILLLNAAHPRLELAERLLRRLTKDLERAARLELSHERETRLEELNEILGQLGANLDPDQVLRLLITRAQTFLGVEAVSLFLMDEVSGELVLQISSQTASSSSRIEQLRVPPGQGIIGYVAQTGETVIVEDARSDIRHYGQVDQKIGFSTHSILAVPLMARSIDLGEERGTSSERIIGGLEALNKLNGRFNQEDAEMLQILAKGAATVHVVAQLYVKSNTLFQDVIQALVAAIDAKDPYTVGHSKRVSEYAIEIARQMGLSSDVIFHIRRGAILHDVGKIGVPDSILGKPGALLDEEMAKIRLHPQIGEQIMRQVQELAEEIPPMAEHHERLDGSGYPAGLVGGQISLSSRIVAVADVFDAMTSDRPYRAGLPVEEVFSYMREHVDTQFDSACVAALIKAHQEGRIRTQIEQKQTDA